MIIGVDAGTSVVKAVAFAQNGDLLRVAARPTRTHTPSPGYAEQDLEEIVAATGEVIREVSAGEAPQLLGITAQGDGLWLLDERGHAVRPPILWSDARAAGVVNTWMGNGVAEAAFRRSGNMLFPGAAAPLLAYLHEHERASLQTATTAGYCKDALLQRLTGVRATDASDASLPFFAPATRKYDDDLLALYGVSAWRHLLAPVDPAPAVAASAREAPIEPPAPPMPAEPVSNAVPAESGTRHILVTFPFGSAALTAEAKSVLRTSLVRTRAHERIVISGRTDSIGSEEVNQQLAMARALAVRNYMRDVVPELPNYISIDARGRCCFIASNDDEAGRSKNRRVEVVFTGRGVM